MTAAGQVSQGSRTLVYPRRGPRPKALHEVVDRILKRSVPKGDCLLFTGAKSGGYGQVRARGLHSAMLAAHRLVFLNQHGYLPSKPYEISHLCDTPACVNIDHIVEETHMENMHRIPPHRRGRPRGETCGKGHPFTPENTMTIRQRGAYTRRCRECKRIHERAYYYAVKEGTR